MKKVVGASATACFMMAALLTGCDNKCGIKFKCDPADGCATAECIPGATSAQVARVITADSSLPCIAVLPFQCVSDDPQSGIIVADSLANSLSAIDGCVVYSPDVVTSKIKFKDGDVIDPVDVGKKMNAPYVLAGRVTEYSIEDEGRTSVGVTARLIDARTGQEVWTARQYEEYMNGTLSGWSDVVSADVAKALSLGEPPAAPVAVAPVQADMPPPPVVTAPPVMPPLPTPVVAAVPVPVQAPAEVEDDVDELYDMDELVDLASNTPPVMEEIRFNSDIEPWDFGLEDPESTGGMPGPIGEEFGVVAGSPLTARYGTPTLPTNKVGQILDQFEDPNPPRYRAPANPEPVQTLAVREGTADVAMPVVAAVDTSAKTSTDKYDALPDIVDAAVITQTMPAESLYAMQGRASDGTVDSTQYHYTGANPFADGPGKKVKERSDSSIDSFIAAELGTVAIHTVYDSGPSNSAAESAEKKSERVESGFMDLPDTLTAYTPESTDYFSDLVPELSGELPEFDMEQSTSFADFMPEPPIAMNDDSPEERPNLYMPTPLDFSDFSAMAAPDLPDMEDEGGKEVMYMPEPLNMEAPPVPFSKEVLPSDDGSFKVTISAEQFLDDEAFDFFGNLSTKLEDLDDIEG